ncbi:MAG TPA: DUF3105 domain-containing protein [Gaiellaceae bacterium]|nr:DUF3105 domain-containing protein [Gaiellaceae bacterium]
MPDKNRVPTPPKRPVQAPKAYKAEHDPRRSRLIFVVVAALIVVAAAAVGIGFIMSGGSDESGGAVGDGTCQRQTFEAQEATHVEELPADFDYNSTPPTSGYHSAQTAIWNLYDQPVPSIHYLHNMEHGGVVVQYGSNTPAETVQRLGNWYDQDTRGLIVAPTMPELEEADAVLADEIVATSWTHMLRCSDFDEGALDDFVNDFRGPQGDAPEKFPLDTLRQGAN